MKRFFAGVCSFVSCLLPLLVLGAAALFGAHWCKSIDSRLRSVEQDMFAPARQPAPLEVYESRVLELPEDGNQWFTVLFVRPGYKEMPAERRAVAAFSSDPTLNSLRLQTHFEVIQTDQPAFQKFAGLIDVTPALLIERPNGQVIYRESGPKLGTNPHGLARAIGCSIERHCPDGRCLPLHPTPVDEQPAAADEPPMLNIPAEAKKKSLVPFVAVAAIAGGAGFARRFRKASGM